MTPDQFVYWMKGIVAASNGGPPHAMAWAAILDGLGKVEHRPAPIPEWPAPLIGNHRYIAECKSGIQAHED